MLELGWILLVAGLLLMVVAWSLREREIDEFRKEVDRKLSQLNQHS